VWDLSSVPADAQVAGRNALRYHHGPFRQICTSGTNSITNVATGITTTTTTNSDGYYTAANLLPGEYQVTVSAKGFATEVRKGISLTVGAQQVINLILQVGSAANTVVEVTTEAPAVQLASSDISAVVNATTVRELPLNGRSWTDLAALQPGVDYNPDATDFAVGADRGKSGLRQQLTISGARPQQNNYRLDGVSLNDYANGAPGSVLGGNLGRGRYSGILGSDQQLLGRVRQDLRRSGQRNHPVGTNTFHGSAYEFLRNSALDARNFFEDPTAPKAPFKRNQFGGAVAARSSRTGHSSSPTSKPSGNPRALPLSTLCLPKAARAGLLCSNPSGADPRARERPRDTVQWCGQGAAFALYARRTRAN